MKFAADFLPHLCGDSRFPMLCPARNDYEPLSSEEEQFESDKESQHEQLESDPVLSAHVEELSSEEELKTSLTTAPRTRPVEMPLSFLLPAADDERGEEEGAQKGAESGEEVVEK
jgi:hypothetical protein